MNREFSISQHSSMYLFGFRITRPLEVRFGMFCTDTCGFPRSVALPVNSFVSGTKLFSGSASGIV